MKKTYDHDLIVIGAGIAGMVSAVTARSLGKQVAVVEKSDIGGNCTHSTCIPSKALIRLGHLGREMKRLDDQGLRSVPGGGLDSRRVMGHIRNIVQKAHEKDLPETFERIGIRVIPGSAAFVDPHRIRINGKVLSAAKFIIAAGTSPLIPEIDGIGDIDFLTNESLYRLDELPKSLLILGGGVDGLEYASAFSGLGVETTVVGTAARVLPGADPELADCLVRELRGQGIRLFTGTVPVNLRYNRDKVTLRAKRGDGGWEEIVADRLLITVGRKPELASLSLDNAGVCHDSRGIVCDRTLRTSVPHIYACGDIVGPYQLASTAEAQAILAATNAFLPFKRKIDYRNSVFLIFTEPPLAYVGLTEEQAREKFGRKMQVYRFEYSNMRRALIDGNDAGMAKLICDGRGKIAGAHLLGDAAGEVIHEFVAMKTWKKPLHRLNAVAHAYPTYAQALAGRAGQLAFLDRMGRNVFVRLALGLLPGFANRLDLARDRLAETHPAGFSSRGGKADRAAGSWGEPPAEIGFSAWRKGEKTGAIGVRHFNGKTLILDMRAVLDAAWEQDLSLAFGEALTTSKNVLLNFSGLLHIDPEGAGLLIVNIVRAARERLDVGACGLSDAFRAVFRLTRLDELIAIFGDEQEALSASTFRKRHFPSSFSPIGPGPIVPGWANPVERLSIIDIPAEAMNINVHGRKTSSPVRGFGRLWDKKYRLRIPGTKIEPAEAISVWKAEFPHFWPEGNRIFYSGRASLAPGTVALLNLKLPGGLVMATGFMVMYADETSFSFLAARGHVISGWITFRIFRENTAVIVQVHPLFRTSDPSFELGFRLGAAKEEDRFWHGTLRNFAGRLGVQGETEQEEVLADPRVQWREFKNLWQNAAIRSVFYMPFYALKRFPGRRENRSGGS